MITASPVLAYFDPEKETRIQVDASKNGLGATLMQDGKPVAFPSKSLTETQKAYAQIEKELLAILFGCEKFHEYLYGRKVIVESDHKPLEAITKKPLASAPHRLQRMLLRLQKYDITVIQRARTLFYWPKLNSDIYNMITKCIICQIHRKSHTKEPLKQHEIPLNPWAKIATDLFSWNNDNYTWLWWII